MSDFDLLKALQKELVDTLSARKQIRNWFPKDCCNAKIHRLRLQIQEVMLRIERKLSTYKQTGDKEKWE